MIREVRHGALANNIDAWQAFSSAKSDLEQDYRRQIYRELGMKLTKEGKVDPSKLTKDQRKILKRIRHQRRTVRRLKRRFGQ